jgi:hypothetical protein
MKKKTYSTLMFLLFTWFVNAQVIPTPSAVPPPPPGLPIDGGVFSLFLMGLIYGIKKLKE